MTQDLAEQPLSLAKARVLDRYARGEIELAQVDRELLPLVPRQHVPRILMVIGVMLGAVLAMLLMPAGTRRE